MGSNPIIGLQSLHFRTSEGSSVGQSARSTFAKSSVQVRPLGLQSFSQRRLKDFVFVCREGSEAEQRTENSEVPGSTPGPGKIGGGGSATTLVCHITSVNHLDANCRTETPFLTPFQLSTNFFR